ncbi:hypothetical protein EMQ25_06050 [Arsenicitalea aurantiaca]|uniref:Uncharacterized protein n=1 Tax=Arsenicitalea aurantiaca TaxID=1783274 RepID=A0A433XF37_9HYPH|nr:hypothetical protein [Arsenicitalea aurantiaca]RUT32705.1 hypothetical protein EMQ25_06050 [Arsenicitalea aurantiaca]
MTNERMRIQLNWKSYLIGAVFIVASMLVFRMALPAILDFDTTLVIASSVIGVMAWFIFMFSRNRAD